jgi:hypothetical protein
MPRNVLPSLAASVVLLAAVPAGASAATCADYSNQADAQRAKDTRDADGDGIYCESLPCPCLKPGQDTGGGGSTPPAPSAPREARCGVERWTVKTLQDSRASRIDFTPVHATVAGLRLLEPPGVGRSSPRLTGEFTTYRVKVRLRSFKLEDDSDIHLVVSDPSGASKTMIVEFPNTGCIKKAGLKSQARMSRARRALIRACGAPPSSGFRRLDGSATITGVAFFDVIHGQRGVAPNGIELHPVLTFTSTGCH